MALGLGAVASGCAGEVKQQPLAEAVAQPGDQFAKSVTVKDDALETKVMFSTEPAFKERRGLMGLVTEDQFLRAFIDKRSGKRSYQVYVVLGYKSDIWREPFQANFGTPLSSEPVRRVMRDSDCKNKRTSGCIRVEHVAFMLPEAEFARVVASASKAAPAWEFRLKTRDGKDYTGVLPLGEFAGLQAAMDAHRPVAMR